MPLSEAQKRANEKYLKKLDKKVKQRYQAKSRAKTFIKKLATQTELLELKAMIEQRLHDYSHHE